MDNPSPYQLKQDPWSSHSIILQWLSEIKPLSSVVEIGTATGILGKLLANRRSFKLIGIEINQEWAEEAKKYYDELIISDINLVDDRVFKTSECVILADILEHLINPEVTLNQIVSFLPNDCHIMISVPNIANIWVRIQLLFGNFNYVDRGILDKTHLRFFTRKSFNEILSENELVIKVIAFTPIPLGLLHPLFLSNFFGRCTFKFLAVITNFFPNLFAYQFLALCQKTKGQI